MARGADSTAGHAAVFRILADPNRLRIIYRLLERGACTVGELADTLDAEHSLVSHHLARLRRRALVTARRSGRLVRYRVAPGVRGALSGRSLELGCCTVTFRGGSPSRRPVARRLLPPRSRSAPPE